jgi:hypothetical protein
MSRLAFADITNEATVVIASRYFIRITQTEYW